MNPNHKGLALSIYQQELIMLSQYLSHIMRGEVEALSYEYVDGGMVVEYGSPEFGIEKWNYPSDINTFMHEQLVRMITAEYSDLDC